MVRNNFYFILSCWVVLLSNLLGCIAVNSGNLESTRVPVKNAGMPKIGLSLTVSATWVLNGKEKILSGELLEEKKKLILEDYKDSGLFNLSEGKTNNDVVIHVELLEIGKVNSGLAMLTGMTFGIFPSWGSSEFLMKTTFIDSQGRSTAEIEARGSQFFVSQLVLIVAMPFFFPFTKSDELITEMNCYSINEAVRKGVIASDK